MGENNAVPLRVSELAHLHASPLLEELCSRWVLIGRPVHESRDVEDGWSFRTRSLHPSSVISSAGGARFLVQEDDVVIPLKKTKAGAFSSVILIGRSGSNDVEIRHPSVSKLHARFTL